MPAQPAPVVFCPSCARVVPLPPDGPPPSRLRCPGCATMFKPGGGATADVAPARRGRLLPVLATVIAFGALVGIVVITLQGRHGESQRTPVIEVGEKHEKIVIDLKRPTLIKRILMTPSEESCQSYMGYQRVKDDQATNIMNAMEFMNGSAAYLSLKPPISATIIEDRPDRLKVRLGDGPFAGTVGWLSRTGLEIRPRG